MRLRVRVLGGPELALQTSPSLAVEELRRVVATQLQCCRQALRLVRRGRVLRDGRVISEYEIEDNDVIQAIVIGARMQPAQQPRTSAASAASGPAAAPVAAAAPATAPAGGAAQNFTQQANAVAGSAMAAARGGNSAHTASAAPARAPAPSMASADRPPAAGPAPHADDLTALLRSRVDAHLGLDRAQAAEAAAARLPDTRQRLHSLRGTMQEAARLLDVRGGAPLSTEDRNGLLAVARLLRDAGEQARWDGRCLRGYASSQ